MFSDMQAESELQFRVCYGEKGLAELQSDWRALYDRIASPAFFQHPDWYAARATASPDLARQTVFAAAWADGRLAAIVPLRERPLRICGVVVRMLEVYDPLKLSTLDAVAEDTIDLSEVRDTLVDFMASRSGLRWHVLSCRWVSSSSAAARVVASAAALSPVEEEVKAIDGIVVRPHEEQLREFPAKLRRNLRNCHRKLAKLGESVFDTCSSLPELRSAFADLLEVEGSGWKGRHGTAIRQNPEVRRLFEDALERFAERGACDIHFLKLDSVPIAAQFCLLAGETAHVLKSGYDERYAHASPGNLLLEHTLRHYSNRGGIRFLDLMDDEPWMRRWNPVRDPVVNVFAFNPRSAKARVCRLAALALKHGRPLYRNYVKPIVKR